MIFKRQAKDPSERVHAALTVLRQQQEMNNEQGIGTDNMPKFQRTKRDLERMGPDAVPALVDALGAPRADRDTPQGEVDQAVAETVAKILGNIGDPRAVGPLFSMLHAGRYLASASIALGKTPEGFDALLDGLDHSNKTVRRDCIRGLKVAKIDRDRAAGGLAKALGDPEAENRRQAALAARQLDVASPQLVDALRRLASSEDEHRPVREAADNALNALGRQHE